MPLIVLALTDLILSDPLKMLQNTTAPAASCSRAYLNLNSSRKLPDLTATLTTAKLYVMSQSTTALKYCLPIIKSSLAEVLAKMRSAPKSYQILEIWLDYIEDLSEQMLDTLIAAREERELLFLLRRQKLDPPKLGYEQRIALLKSLTAHPSKDQLLIDLDIREQKAEVEWLATQNHTTPLILSYHNYETTPQTEELRIITNEMSRNKATIYKFSTYCQTQADALRLLQLQLELRTQNKRHTVLGMGADGLVTRLFGPLWGSEIAYAPQVMANSSAPGQLTLEELQRLLEQLKVIHER